MSDFKELIPEFYDTDQCDFLSNKYNIDFGFRHDGRKVSDVELPSWSKSKYKFFLGNLPLIIVKLLYLITRS